MMKHNQTKQYQVAINNMYANTIIGVYPISDEIYLYLYFTGKRYRIFIIDKDNFIKLNIIKRIIGKVNKQFLIKQGKYKFVIRFLNHNSQIKIKNQYTDKVNDTYLTDLFYDVAKNYIID